MRARKYNIAETTGLINAARRFDRLMHHMSPISARHGSKRARGFECGDMLVSLICFCGSLVAILIARYVRH